MLVTASPFKLGSGIALGGAVNWAHPLNQGRVAWLLATPGRMAGTTWSGLPGRNHGVLTNGPTWQGTSRPGGWGCLRFDGSDDFVRINNTPQLQAVGTGDYYVSFWLNMQSTPNQFDTVASSYVGSVSQYNIISFRNDTSHLNILVNTGTGLDAPVAVTLGVWEWWLFGRDGSNLVLSRNGSAPATAVDGTSDHSSDYGWTIGNEKGGDFGDRCPNMLMDDISIGTQKPTAAFCSALYRSSLAGYPGVLNDSSPVVWQGATAAAPPAVTPLVGDFSRPHHRRTPNVMIPVS